MKKVLLTVNNSILSGIEKFTLLLVSHLDKSKYAVEIGLPTYGPFCKILEENNIDYFIFDNKVNGRFTFSGIVFLFKQIFREKYDIIHAQAGIAPCLIGKLSGTKLLIEHKHGLDFTTEQIQDMNFISLSYQRLKKYFVHLTLTGCEADKKILTEKFNYNDERVIVVYNGIEGTVKERKMPKNTKFTVGTIGRLTYQKGQEYFIEMARILRDKDYDFEYHIYGEGENYDFYLELIEKYDLSENVRLKGYSENVTETMNSFDVFVLPSRYEGIPYVLLEAMKLSVPLIVTDVGGIREVISNEVNGILVSKENAHELADKIIMLYNSPDKRKLLAQIAKRDFENKYTLDKTIESIDSIYSKDYKN